MFIKFVLYSKTNKTTAIVLPLQLTSPYIYIYIQYIHMGNTKSQKSSATVLILKNTTVLCLSRRFTLCSIPRPIRLEASLKAWSFPANSKSVLSSMLV